MNEIEKYKNLFPFNGKITHNSLVLPRNLEYIEWKNIIDYLFAIEGSVQWWIGDGLNYGENKYGEMYSQVLDATEYDYQTLRNYKWVSGRVELSARADNLSWKHHEAVASLTPEEQIFFLNKAIEGKKLTTRELKELVRKYKREIETPILPEGKFNVIVVDPPWQMEKIEREVRPNQVKMDYELMSEDELLNLTIPYADDCHIWLWTTHRFMPLAFEMLKQWGANYVCTFVWHKPGGFQPVGLPQYNCEFALYARIGSPTFSTTKNFPVCFDAPRGEHSVKPKEFYNIIRQVTNGRRLDMFNRREIDGFETWGKEAQ